MAASALRWGRIVLGGFLVEAILIAVVIPMRMAGSGETPITVLAVGGSFLVCLAVAWLLSRSSERAIVHGVLIGVVAVAIYTALSLLQQAFDPNAPTIPGIYYAAHVLKLAGGAMGGWLGERSAAPREPAAPAG